MKPKRQYAAKSGASYDQCQTPEYAIKPLLDHIPKNWVIWESACGEGNLGNAFRFFGYNVIESDICFHEQFDFFTWTPANEWDCQITNPPYSIKYKWLARSYELGKPFALLMPLETLGAWAAQKLFKAHGIKLIIPRQRINFKMPEKGWDGKGAQFPTVWFCYGLHGIIQELNFVTIDQKDIRQSMMEI